MLGYLARRIVYLIPTLLFISILCFAIIQLPPGDFLAAYVSQLSFSGETTQAAEAGERAPINWSAPRFSKNCSSALKASNFQPQIA